MPSSTWKSGVTVASLEASKRTFICFVAMPSEGRRSGWERICISTASEIIGEVCGEQGKAMRGIVFMKMSNQCEKERNSVLWRRSFSEFVENEERSLSHRPEEESSACEVLRERRFSVANTGKEGEMHGIRFDGEEFHVESSGGKGRERYDVQIPRVVSSAGTKHPI